MRVIWMKRTNVYFPMRILKWIKFFVQVWNYWFLLMNISLMSYQNEEIPSVFSSLGRRPRLPNINFLNSAGLTTVRAQIGSLPWATIWLAEIWNIPISVFSNCDPVTVQKDRCHYIDTLEWIIYREVNIIIRDANDSTYYIITT